MSDAHVIPVPPPSIFDTGAAKLRNLHLFAKAKAKVQDIQFKRAQSRLEKDVGRIVETMQGHKDKKLAPGHSAYVELYRTANAKIDAFCQRHDVPRERIVQQMPVLRDLELLTHPVTTGQRVSQGVGVLVGIAFGAILIGLASGLVSVVYHWVAGW